MGSKLRWGGGSSGVDDDESEDDVFHPTTYLSVSSLVLLLERENTFYFLRSRWNGTTR